MAQRLPMLWSVSGRWETGCVELLGAVMPHMVEALERHGELKVTADVRRALLEISPATIDRLISSHRRR